MRLRKKIALLGFTLLELLVVIVIIGLLASYVGPKYFSHLGRSEVTVAKSQIEAFESALNAFRIDIGRFPTTEEGLISLIEQPPSIKKWNGPYLMKQIPDDPWGNPYQYQSTSDPREYLVFSYGKDGQVGGSDENADVFN